MKTSNLEELFNEIETLQDENQSVESGNNADSYLNGSASNVMRTASGNSGSNRVPYIMIGVNRFGFGEKTTLSRFVANAYDADGNLIDTLEGYFLEPGFDPDRSTVKDSDTAIPGGTYEVVPSTWHQQSGYFEVTGVSGRTYIKIHGGNIGKHTEGCLMPGSRYTYDPVTNEYTLDHSSRDYMMGRFREFMNTHASGYATMSIQP